MTTQTDEPIVITRAEVEADLRKTFTDDQWATFRTHVTAAIGDALFDLGEEIIRYGTVGQTLSADSVQEGDVVLDQDRNGPFTVLDIEPITTYLRLRYRRADGSEFTDTAAFEAKLTCLGGPSYVEDGGLPYTDSPPTLPDVAAFLAESDGQVRGCSCGMADHGTPGHDGHTDTTEENPS